MDNRVIFRQAAIDAIVAWTVEDRPDIEMPTDLVRRINALPSAQPDLTDEDRRLIKKLRSFHNGSYAKVLDKLIASAQPEIIRCKDCMHNGSYDTDCPIHWNGKEYCSFAERRTDETD